MYYVYVLQSLKKNWVYIGYTNDLKARFAQHQKGKVTSTKPNRPFTLVYYEAYKNKTDARKRELELKNHSQQKEFLFKRISNSLNVAPSSNG